MDWLLMWVGTCTQKAQANHRFQSIVGWELVTANGTIVNVDAQDQPELAVALRGSGSQFGQHTYPEV